MDTPQPPVDNEDLLQRFKTAARKAAQGLHYREVVRELGEFGELQERHHAECQGATLFPWGIDADISVGYNTGTPSFAPNGVIESLEPSDRVLSLELSILNDAITLGEVERVMGDWYRDPPSPCQVSFGHAYFNAQAICPGPHLFLFAVSQPYADSLGPQSPICTVGLQYGDHRYEKDEPW